MQADQSGAGSVSQDWIVAGGSRCGQRSGNRAVYWHVQDEKARATKSADRRCSKARHGCPITPSHPTFPYPSLRLYPQLVHHNHDRYRSQEPCRVQGDCASLWPLRFGTRSNLSDLERRSPRTKYPFSTFGRRGAARAGLSHPSSRSFPMSSRPSTSTRSTSMMPRRYHRRLASVQ
jgi:hypothetical protein